MRWVSSQALGAVGNRRYGLLYEAVSVCACVTHRFASASRILLHPDTSSALCVGEKENRYAASQDARVLSLVFSGLGPRCCHWCVCRSRVVGWDVQPKLRENVVVAHAAWFGCRQITASRVPSSQQLLLYAVSDARFSERRGSAFSNEQESFPKNSTHFV